jgi:hypothetical protein
LDARIKKLKSLFINSGFFLENVSFYFEVDDIDILRRRAWPFSIETCLGEVSVSMWIGKACL